MEEEGDGAVVVVEDEGEGGKCVVGSSAIASSAINRSEG